MKQANFAVISVSIYLLIYTIFAHSPAMAWLTPTMFVLSPFLVIWMVYTVLKKGEYNGPELASEQEFGYQDRPDLSKSHSRSELN
jgi:hypothetical protein